MVTSWPNWSRKVKSGAGVPRASPGTSVEFRELTLEDLASRVAWKRIQEHDLARNLVSREVLPHPVLEVVLARPGFVPRNDEGAQPAAELVVVDTDRGHLEHALVPGQAVLDLLREDVLATGHNHLVVASLDVETALLVEPADVARRHQAVDNLLRLPTGVALEQQAVPDEDPAGLASGGLSALVVQDLHHRRPGRLPGRG